MNLLTESDTPVTDEDEYNIYVIFNKKTRQVSTYTFDISAFPQSILDSMLIKKFSFKELGILDENINLSRFRWIGDYEGGTLVDINQKRMSITSEAETLQMYRDMFFKKFNAQDVIIELVRNCLGPESEMKIFADKVIKKRDADIAFFKSSPLHIWESAEDVVARQHAAFDV